MWLSCGVAGLPPCHGRARATATAAQLHTLQSGARDREEGAGAEGASLGEGAAESHGRVWVSEWRASEVACQCAAVT